MYFLVLVAWLAFAGALQLLEKSDNPAVVHAGITKVANMSSAPTELKSIMSGTFYSLNFSIGNPPQPLSAILDTGSRPVVLNSEGSVLCLLDHCENGSYNQSKSSTGVVTGTGLKIHYELGDGIGEWMTDELHFGETSMKDFPFGLMTAGKSTSPQSWFGLGFPEPPLGWAGQNEPVNTTLRTMANSGAINSASAAIRLREPASIVFGGVDTSAYTGDLVTLPMVPNPILHVYESMAINLTWVAVFANNEQNTTDVNSLSYSEFPIRIMVDTSSFDVKLPTDFVKLLWKHFHINQTVSLPDIAGEIVYGLCPCSLANSTQFINFGFPGFTVNIPMRSLVLNPPQSLLDDFHAPHLPGGVCVFGINPNPDEDLFPMILGPPILENMYLVIDQDNHEFGIAQLNPNPGPPNIREIAPGTKGLDDLLNGLSSTTSTPSSTSTAAPQTPTASPPTASHVSGLAMSSVAAAHNALLPILTLGAGLGLALVL